MNEHDFNTETESLLLANDSTVTHVRIIHKISTVSWLETFQRFCLAIARNTVMDHLTIDVREIGQLGPGNGTELLLQAVEESNYIKTIAIEKGILRNESSTFAGGLVYAISRNTTIESCRFHVVCLDSQDVATLLQDSSCTEIFFEKTGVDFNIDTPGFEDNVEDLGDAFERNITLVKLSFEWLPMFARNNRTILEAANRSNSIKYLTVEFDQESGEEYDPELLTDISVYLNKSKVKFVTLDGMKWDITTLRAFTSHISREADPIKCLKFYNCSFDKDASILLKEFAFGNKHIQGLSFSGNKTAFSNEINVLGEIIGKEKGPKFLILHPTCSCLSSPTNGLESICTGLASKTSELHVLTLPRLSPSQLEYFLDKIPTFKNVRTLWLYLDTESEHLKQKIFSSFSRNGCLWKSKVNAPWMTGQDSHHLDRICQRNKTLPDLERHISRGLFKLPISSIPSFFYSAVVASSGTGPKGIVTMLTLLDDKICSPDSDDKFSSSKRLRMD